MDHSIPKSKPRIRKWRAFRREIELRFLSFLAWALIQFIGRTGRFRTFGLERVRELVDSGKGFIMATWHGRTLLPVFRCRGMGMWAITSLSRDGELQTRILERLGFRTIRGSTGRGGMRAALAACKRLEEGGILAITPDGPRGPANQVQEGIVFMARRAGCPIVPIGVDARPRRIMRAWDGYLLPRPFARVALVFGEPITISGTCSEERPEDVIKAALDSVQARAEEMVMAED